MRYKIFLDSNILISGIFYSGLENFLLKQDFIFITSDVNYNEVLEVAKRKSKKFGDKIVSIALEKVRESFLDMEIIKEREWSSKLDEASKYIKGQNDRKILAAVLLSNPDYFITNDKDFHTSAIKKLIKAIKTRELLEELNLL